MVAELITERSQSVGFVENPEKVPTNVGRISVDRFPGIAVYSKTTPHADRNYVVDHADCRVVVKKDAWLDTGDIPAWREDGAVGVERTESPGQLSYKGSIQKVLTTHILKDGTVGINSAFLPPAPDSDLPRVLVNVGGNDFRIVPITEIGEKVSIPCAVVDTGSREGKLLIETGRHYPARREGGYFVVRGFDLTGMEPKVTITVGNNDKEETILLRDFVNRFVKRYETIFDGGMWELPLLNKRIIGVDKMSINEEFRAIPLRKPAYLAKCSIAVTDEEVCLADFENAGREVGQYFSTGSISSPAALRLPRIANNVLDVNLRVGSSVRNGDSDLMVEGFVFDKSIGCTLVVLRDNSGKQVCARIEK